MERKIRGMFFPSLPSSLPSFLPFFPRSLPNFTQPSRRDRTRNQVITNGAGKNHMVTKFKSEYGNSDLQRNRGKYENRPDLKKRERERKWRGDGRLENLISELHRLRLARSSSVRKLRAGIVIRSGRRCAQFIRRGVNRRGEKIAKFR